MERLRASPHWRIWIDEAMRRTIGKDLDLYTSYSVCFCATQIYPVVCLGTDHGASGDVHAAQFQQPTFLDFYTLCRSIVS